MEDNSQHHVMVEGEYSPKEVAKFVLVIAGILAASLWLTSAYGPSTWQGWMRWFMGVFFLMFACFKLVGYKMFADMFAGYDIIAKRVKVYGYAYPFIELGLAISYLANVAPGARDWLALTVMGVGSIGVFGEIRKRSGIHCACLGNIIKLPLSTVSLIEDVGMGIMAAIMIITRG